MTDVPNADLDRVMLHRDPTRPFLILGPCVVESRDLAMQTAEAIARLSADHDVPVIYKSSFEKANRTSASSFTGIGTDAALGILAEVKAQFGLPILSDVHEYSDLDAVCAVVDVLQTPAFLCRQTEYLHRVAMCGKITNIKKGQFLSAEEMVQVAQKFAAFGNERLLLCERGTTFGYNYLINDFRGFQTLQASGWPLVFDATHSVQRPGGAGQSSGGDRHRALGLARAALAVGTTGIFAETHPDPANAKSDGPNMIPLGEIEKLFRYTVAMRAMWQSMDVTEFPTAS